MNRIYIYYSHEDEAWKNRLVDHFRRLEMEGQLSFWTDQRIPADAPLDMVSEEAKVETRIVLLLISVDFLYSDLIIKKVIPELLERRVKDGLRIISLLVRPCTWRSIEWLNKLPMYPQDGTPLALHAPFDRDMELANFVSEVKTIYSQYEEQISEPTFPASSLAKATFDLSNPVFNVQYRPKREGLVGRENALNKVRQQLLTGKPTAIGHTVAFQGLGGLGKTQLAVDYAYRFRDEYPNGVIWFNADQDIDAQLIQIAKQAKWISPDSKHEDILAVAKQRIKTWSQCLIIFDNVENQETIKDYFPVVDAKPHLLATSRTVQLGFVSIAIDLLNEEQSLQLLFKESARNMDTLSEAEKKAAREIAIAMDGLPLAIEIAGAYLNQIPGCTFSNYQSMLTDNFNQVMAGDLLFSLTQHERNLFHTLQVSQPVFKQAPLLPEILDLLAWSGSAFMGISLMATILDKKEGNLMFSLQMGLKLRILHKASEGERYDIHRLVRKVHQEQFPLEDRIPWVKAVCVRLGNWFEERRQELTNLPIYEAEIDHLKEWLSHVTPHSDEQTARLIWLLAYPLYHWGKYKETHQCVLIAFGLLEKLPDVDPKLKANVLSDLGTTYGLLGNYQEALKYQKQALEIRRQLFGELHPDTATSFNNVGSIYGDMGNHKEALKYQEQALEILRQLFGEQHPNTATIITNVGSTYDNLGNHKEALKYHEQALAIQRQLLGEQHPDTALSLHKIGYTYGDLGKLIEAFHFSKQAYNIRSQILGEQHPNTASSLYYSAFFQMKLKQFKDAYQQVKAYLKNLPVDHPGHDKLTALLQQIDRESVKAGFRAPSKKR